MALNANNAVLIHTHTPFPPPLAKLFFPPQFRTPSTNSFAYSQSETIPPPPPEPMIWIFMTCVFGIRVRMCVDLLFWGKEEEYVCTYTRKMHTTKFTCNEWRPPTAIQVAALVMLVILLLQVKSASFNVEDSCKQFLFLFLFVFTITLVKLH